MAVKGKLAEYVVRNNPQGASRLLTQNYNMKPTRSMAQMVQQMNYIIMQYKEEALRDIANIHPDREIMSVENEVIDTVSIPVQNFKDKEPVSNCDGCDKLTEKQSGCAGCGGTCGGSSSATGGCGCGGSSNAGGCGCSGSSNANGRDYNRMQSWEKSSNANGDTPTATDTKPAVVKEDGVGKAITYLSVGIVAVIIAGIVFKPY